MQEKLDEFVEKLKVAASGNLKAVVLYGSAVTGEFHSKHSDLNTLCVVERANVASLADLHPVGSWWIRQGHPAPLVFTLEDLHLSSDMFAIELLDIKAHHKMLFGGDFLSEISVPLQYHALQVEHELRAGWLRLRQAILTGPNKGKARLDLMVSSFSTFVTLFRHILVALGGSPTADKREAIDGVAKFAGADAGGFHAILELREEKRKERDIDIEATLHRYFEFVQAVTNEFDRRIEVER